MDYKKLSTKAATPPHLESPAVKRQKKSDGGYNSTATSAQNTGPYNSDNDSGDELFAGWVPDTPGGYQTQPTQIIDRSLQVGSNPPDTTNHIVQVPASSPFSGRDNHSPQPAANNVNKLVQNGGSVARNPVSMGMAPAGTTYRPPQGIVSKPVLNFITIDDDDDGPQFQGGSSDEDVLTSADIKPTMFMSRSANNSFGTSATKDGSKNGNGNAKFMDIVQNAAYKPQQQTRPERAQPVTGNVFDTWSEKEMLDRINQVRKIVPNMGEMTIKNALSMNKGSLDDTVAYLCDEERLVAQRPTSHWQSKPGVRIEISDDEIELPLASKAQPDMKRVLAKPVQSINQKYSSTQTLLPKPVSTSTPPKPKRRLVPGRRNPSSPAAPSPLRPDSPAAESYDSDSGVGSVVEEDPELEVRVLSYLNKCTVTELIELTATKQEIAELMISARPFKTLDAARCVENVKVLKSGKKSNRAPVGDKVVDKALEMFQGYEAIDTLIERCSDIGKPLADEMATWGFDVFGARKGGELEITSLEENDSLQDSGVGSPASGLASAIVDDDVKIISRKRSAVQFLKKPEIMADSCKLKDYQVVGLNWLALMYRKKLSGILADEMGLGKTCQVISFLSHLMEQGNHGPHLVVCPGTTLENWMREFQKFSPQVVTYAYHGKQTERPEMAEFVLENRDRINVVVTTYEMAASKEDNKFMRKLRPDVCVYDEGHYLKNVKSQRYQGLIKIPASFRLLLTGTPLQNNLRELAALLAFMLPSVFKEVEEDLEYIFKAKATTSDESHAALLSQQRIARARSMLTPFVLRRKKEQVMKDLPIKTSRVVYCRMTKEQKVIYDGHEAQVLDRARIRVGGGRVPKSDENNPMMQLRKAAIHPQLFRRHFTDASIEKMCDILRKKVPEEFLATQKRNLLIAEMCGHSDFVLHRWCMIYPCINTFDVPELSWMKSGKVKSFLKLVKEYKNNGDRVLVFSQFALVLNILEAVLNSSLISYTRIDGSTSIDQRQSLIDTFTEDESITVFMLTTKAGGTGINLVAANKVIIFDGSFNPQDDRQAENRAHRVGQTRPVEVIQLVTKGTVEERIWNLGQSKLLLDGKVAGDDTASAALEEAGEMAVLKMMLNGEGLTKGEVSDGSETEEETNDKEVVKDEEPTPRKKATIKLVVNKKRHTSSAGKGKSQKSITVDEDD